MDAEARKAEHQSVRPGPEAHYAAELAPSEQVDVIIASQAVSMPASYISPSSLPGHPGPSMLLLQLANLAISMAVL